MKAKKMTEAVAQRGTVSSEVDLSAIPPLDPEDDQALATRIAAGDRDAFEQVFKRFGGAVRSMALRVLRDETLADDVVQEVFVRFWNEPERFDQRRGTLRTFLVTLAHRRAVDVIRSEEARSRREERVPTDVSSSIDEEVWARSLSEKVRAALGELSDDEREAITLAYFGGLSYVEVANRLGAPEGTVKSRIRAGMKKLSGTLAATVSQ